MSSRPDAAVVINRLVPIRSGLPEICGVIVQSLNVIKLFGVKKIVLIAQERSSFLHVAPLVNVLKNNALLEPVLVRALRPGDSAEHDALTAAFGFADEIRTVPIEAGTPVGETAALMFAFERIFTEIAPDFVVPGGPDSAALAASLVASRMGIPVVSLDAGLRSYDRTEPDEVTRLVIDAIATLHFVSEHSGIYNLINEGFADDTLLFAGNTTIDSLVTLIGQTNNSGVLDSFEFEPKKFVTVLLGMPLRAETAQNSDTLCKILESIAATTTVLLPCGTKPAESLHEVFGSIPGIKVVGMPGYIDMLRVLKDSAFVLTDTSEFEAELTVMNVPCLTMRETTARPSTIEVGTNVLVECDEQEILERASVILSGKPTGKTLIPEKWDGASAARIAEVLERAE
ncbi:MAG: UDP-N-acetyl glucosamine 2-epimerase [Chlorobiaceae bacterium]|nr:UDP-N-acetyl glucosamine 2-epimerase [Chlorobiaceae bacterium]